MRKGRVRGLEGLRSGHMKGLEEPEKGSKGPEKLKKGLDSGGTRKGDLKTLGVFCRRFDGPGSL